MMNGRTEVSSAAPKRTIVLVKSRAARCLVNVWAGDPSNRRRTATARVRSRERGDSPAPWGADDGSSTLPCVVIRQVFRPIDTGHHDRACYHASANARGPVLPVLAIGFYRY